MVIRPDGQNPRLSRPERKAITIMVRLTVGRKKNGQQLDKSHCPIRGGMNDTSRRIDPFRDVTLQLKSGLDIAF